MPMPRITASQLRSFRLIKEKFPIQNIPSQEAWRDASDDDVWIRVVSQVVVIGNASPAAKLWTPPIRKRIGWKNMTKLPEAEARKEIWSVLREIGTRWCGQKCPKADGLMRNLKFLRDYPGGPKGFLKDVATLDGSSLKKVNFVGEHLSYIKDKGARDFLTTGFGLVRDCIAFDTRIRGVIREIGVQIPESVKADSAQYENYERLLINEVCRPLHITGAQLDQLLFNNSKEIINMLKR